MLREIEWHLFPVGHRTRGDMSYFSKFGSFSLTVNFFTRLAVFADRLLDTLIMLLILAIFLEGRQQIGIA